MREHTRDLVIRTGGHGDRIMALAHDWSKPWYVKDKIGSDVVVFEPTFRAPRGSIEISPGLAAWADSTGVAGHALLVPHIKGKFSSTNKDWGWHRWQTFAARSRLPLAQCSCGGRPVLDGVLAVETPTFEHACAVLAACRCVVTTEGGMHHAAAALGRPAVVIWGCFSDPEILGYQDHINLYEPDSEGLGQRRPHPACRKAMERITVERVTSASEEAYERG